MENFYIGQYSFEEVKDFKYLVVNIDQRVIMCNE